MALFKNLASAKPQVSSEYIGTGHYFLRINKCKKGSNRSEIPFTAVEMVVIAVLASSAPAEHSVGSEVTDLKTKGGDAGDYHDAELLAFLLCVTGKTEAQFKAEWNDETENAIFGNAMSGAVAVDGPQALRGYVVEMENFGRAGKKENADGSFLMFTKKKYIRVVPPIEVLATLMKNDPTGELKNRFFPNNYLEQAIAIAKKLSTDTPHMPSTPEPSGTGPAVCGGSLIFKDAGHEFLHPTRAN
jgi:hypothetical protein